MLALPPEEAASVGMPGTETTVAGRSLETSTRRTLPSARASTKPALQKLVERSSGYRWKRSETLTIGSRAFGTRKVRRLSGVA